MCGASGCSCAMPHRSLLVDHDIAAPRAAYAIARAVARAGPPPLVGSSPASPLLRWASFQKERFAFTWCCAKASSISSSDSPA